MRCLTIVLRGAGWLAASALVWSVLSAPALAQTDIYSWTDRNGVRHVSVFPPPRGETVQDLRTMHTTPAEEDSSQEGGNATGGGDQGTQSVEIYVDGKSQDCMTALSFFKANGIPVTQYNVTASPEARERFNSLQGKALPLILIGDKRMDGWNEKTAREYMGLP